MPTFITTIKYTEQGITNIKDTCKRSTAFKTAAKKAGVKIKELYWTLGPADGVIIAEAADEETMTAAMLNLSKLGNVKTETTRAYKLAEMKSILEKV